MPPAVSASRIFQPTPRPAWRFRRREKLCASQTETSTGLNSLPWSAGQEDIKLVVEPFGGIEGKIVVEGGNQAAARRAADVAARWAGLYLSVEREPAQSGADGAFHISDVAAGSYQIHAVFGTNAVSEWVADMVPVSVESGEVTRGVQVTAAARRLAGSRRAGSR